MDHVSRKKRSAIMAAVKNKDTKPELIVRRALHKLGYRYRVHVKNLPGSPDMAFASRKKVLFVHGCFWHGHGCGKGRLPKSRLDYWAPKIAANRDRDSRNLEQLLEEGWEALVVWQCELKNIDATIEKIANFLNVVQNADS